MYFLDSIFFLVFVTFLPHGHGAGIFSKIMNRGKSEIEQSEDFDVCESIRVMPRIALAVVGGTTVKFENSAPYIAAVGERTSNGSVSWFCGGSLISAIHILTAAHCLISRNVTTIRVGSFSVKKRSTENDFEVTETIIHPGYKITESYNDIAIIKVKGTINFSKNIKPVCLPQDDNDRFENERAKVIGWGAEEFGGEGSQKLQQVEVEVFSNSNCEKAYLNSTIAPKTFPKGIKREQLCAGSSKGGKDACQGDSGGPLVLTDNSGIVRQIGIVSTGAGCGFKMYPGVYARVSSYIDWIEQIKNSGSKQSIKSSGNLPSEKKSNPTLPKNKQSQRLTKEENERKFPQTNGQSSEQLKDASRERLNGHRGSNNRTFDSGYQNGHQNFEGKFLHEKIPNDHSISNRENITSIGDSSQRNHFSHQHRDVTDRPQSFTQNGKSVNRYI